MTDAEREIRIVISGRNMAGPEFEKARLALAGVSAETKKTDDTMQKMWTGVKGAAGLLGVTFGISTVTNFAGSVFTAAERIKDMSDRLGVGYEAAQRFKYAAEQSGATIDDVEKAISIMSRTLAVGDKSTVAALSAAGLKFSEVRNMRIDKAFLTIGDAIGDMEDPMARAHAAQELFGKGALKLIPAMVAGFEKVGQAAHFMATDAVEGLEQAKQNWDNFWNHLIVSSGNAVGGIMKGNATFQASVSKAIESITLMTSAQRDAAKLAQDDSGVWQEAFRIWEKGGKDLKLSFEEATPPVMTATEELRRLREDSVVPLSAETRKLIAGFDSYGMSVKDIAAKVGVNELAVRRYIESLRTQKQTERELVEAAARADKERLERLKAFEAEGAKAEAEETARQKRQLLAFNDGLMQMADLERDYLIERERLTLSAYDFELREIDRWVAAQKAGFKGTLEQVHSYYAAIDALADERRAKAANQQGYNDWAASAFAGQAGMTSGGQGMDPRTDVPRTDLFNIREFGEGLSTTVLQAFTGGGDVGASAGSFVGKQFGLGLQRTLGDEFKDGKVINQGWLTKNLGDTVGGAVAASLPIIGSLAGPLASKLVDVFTGGSQANKLRDSLKEKFGDAAGEGLAMAVEKVATSDAVQKAYDRFLRAGSKKEVEDSFKDLTAAMDKAESVMKKYGLSLEDTLSPQERLSRGVRDVTKDLTQLRDLGFSTSQTAKAMAKELNDLFRVAIDNKSQLPDSIRPYLEELARGGLLADDLKAKLLGLPVQTKAPWKEMQEIAGEFGIDLKNLGPQFQAAKLGETSEEFGRKFRLLVDNGADVQSVIGGMGKQANNFLNDAMRWGLELPPSMRPLLEKMRDAGDLIDDNGEKITDLGNVKWAKDPAEMFQPLVDALNDLVGVFRNDLPSALDHLRGEAARGVDIPVRMNPSGSGNADSGSSMDLDGDGVPNWDDREPYDPNAYASGGIARGRQIARLAENGKKEIVGDIDFMTRALTGAVANAFGHGQLTTAHGNSMLDTWSQPRQQVIVQNIINGRHISDLVIEIVKDAAGNGRIQIPRRAVTPQVPIG